MGEGYNPPPIFYNYLIFKHLGANQNTAKLFI